MGCTYAAIIKQNLLTYSLSTGVSFFTISGMFFGKWSTTVLILLVMQLSLLFLLQLFFFSVM